MKIEINNFYGFAYEIDKTPLLEYNNPKDGEYEALTGSKELPVNKWQHLTQSGMVMTKFKHDLKMAHIKDDILLDPELYKKFKL